MEYGTIVVGRFVNRPNRFIANVEIDGVIEVCHVKNTGRCKELLVEGARVYLEDCGSPKRKTRYDLVAVLKGNILINMDSQAPNKAVGEWLREGNLFTHPDLIKAEKTDGNSRVDFYIEEGSRKAFLEVKGVTLENQGKVLFPDAPTERGVKHLQHLEEVLERGYEAYIMFVVQLKGASSFSPNDETHKAFGEALRHAKTKGVHVLVYDCIVTPKTMIIDQKVLLEL